MALRGINVIELVGLAPAPFCGLILSDFGANVVRVDRVSFTLVLPSSVMDSTHYFTHHSTHYLTHYLTQVRRGNEASEPFKRGKKSIALDLKQEEGKVIFKKLCSKADVVIEPFRPGVMEKLGLGPCSLSEGNQGLIYARLSGFGQTGPMSKAAGHDINYLAISGVLSLLGGAEPEKPTPPINILADFAGGGLIGAFGILVALFERITSGKGQVVDANLVEGTAYVSSGEWLTRDQKNTVSQLVWPNRDERGKNLLDGGAPYYQVYRCKDGKYMAVGSLEPQFYSGLMKGLGMKEEDFNQYDIQSWPKTVEAFQEVFLTKTQCEWSQIFTPLDCCVTPVIHADQAPHHPHNKERGTFMPSGHPRPAPLLSRTPGVPDLNEPRFAQHTAQLLTSLGYSEEQVRHLAEKGIVALDEADGLKSNL